MDIKITGPEDNVMLRVVYVIVCLVAITITCNIPEAYAGSYRGTKIDEIFTDASGNVLISWPGFPNTGPCGSNYGWVSIPVAASKELKALAMALYLSGRPIGVDTGGCDRTYEKVVDLYGQ